MKILFLIVFLHISGPAFGEEKFGSFLPPEPNQIIKNLSLWSTHYKIHLAKHLETHGIRLIDKYQRTLGPKLSERDFCGAAMQGTVTVKFDGKLRTFNSIDSKGSMQANCLPFYKKAVRLKRISRATVVRLGRKRFFATSVLFGLGVKNWHLQPFRSIAVDPSIIPYRSILFIDQARGKTVTLPDGTSVIHDGFFYAIDTGSNILGNHIDIFGGLQQSNPFPSFVKSHPNKTFKAKLVRNPEIKAHMDAIHRSRSN